MHTLFQGICTTNLLALSVVRYPGLLTLDLAICSQRAGLVGTTLYTGRRHTLLTVQHSSCHYVFHWSRV